MKLSPEEAALYGTPEQRAAASAAITGALSAARERRTDAIRRLDRALADADAALAYAREAFDALTTMLRAGR